MIIEDIIQNLKTELASLTWQPSGNVSATSFVGGVFTAPYITEALDSPWCFITDEPSPQITKRGTRGAQGDTLYQKDQGIGIYICARYGDEVVSIEEAYKRVRYAVEAVEGVLKSGVKLTTIGVTGGWNYLGWTNADQNASNALVRRLTLVVTDTV
jgi:hypothetical protein